MPIIATPWRADHGDQLSCINAMPVEQLCPADLPTKIHEHYRALAAENNPPNHLVRILVQQIARHAGALDFAHSCELTILQTGGLRATPLGNHCISEGDAQRIGAVTGPALLAVGAYQGRHERGLIAVIRQLFQQETRSMAVEVPDLFGTEDDCNSYLATWQQRQPWVCPACGGKTRYWLRGRRKFECECRKQYTIRFGTIFEKSHVALMVWFSVIAHVICDNSIHASLLAGKLKVARTATIKKMMVKVSAALMSPCVDQQLASVNQLALASLRQALTK